MIVATAGHVDHGKTSLIKALTGVETDTLAEEQARGLSINLGYAHVTRSDGSLLSFIDVPGHHRFMNTMIAGIGGIDRALLVVAADDGPMPQTVEHLDVLELLGISELTVAISKIDRVDTARIEAVGESIASLLATRGWTDPENFLVSSVTGEGIDALKAHLMTVSAQTPATDENEGFRLSIDRRFNVKGQGLVVTGTASAGSVSVGDTLALQPSGMELRIRGLRCHDQNVDTARSGQRIAINLAGRVELEDVERGDWLTSPNSTEPSSRLDVSFSLLSDAPFALKRLAPVKLHLGAKRVSGRLALVSTSKRRLEPGDEGLAQLILDDKVSSMVGDRFVIRDHAETRVLGGGRVLDPNGPKQGKSRAGRLQWLSAMQISDHELALQALLQNRQVVDIERFWRSRNQMNSMQTPIDSHGFSAKGKTFVVSESYWKQACEQVSALLNDFHRHAPTQPGLRAPELINRCKSLLGTTLTQGVIVALAKTQSIKEKDGFIRTAAFASNEQAEAIPNWSELESVLKHAGKNIPMMSELAALSRLTETQLTDAVKAGIERGLLHRISPNRVALPQQLLWFANQTIATEAAGTELSVIELKTQFGLGRKLTIEVLEYFDRVKFTRRIGDKRIIVNNDNVLDRFKT